MILYPAIDLMGGQCVRLYKGDFNQSVTYAPTPVEVAKTYQDEGAEWLHLVDLDGARDPAKRQTDLIASIIKGTGLCVQTGGGVRSADDVARLVDAGASRVVIGSLAVKDPDAVRAIIAQHGSDKICLAADVMRNDQHYMIAVHGWQEESTLTLRDFLARFPELKHSLCTDISKDGTLQGPNVDLYERMAKSYPSVAVQASGGVSSLDDLRALKDAGAAGAIIGKALYEGKFAVREALALC